MRCTLAKKLIPLFVSDDLPDEQMFALREHLEACEACRELTEEFAESQLWLRTYMAHQFPEAIFDDLRDGLQKNLALAEPKRRWFEQLVPAWSPMFVFTASVITLLLIAGLGVYLARHRPPRNLDISIDNRRIPQNNVNPGKAGEEKQPGGVKERPDTRQSIRPPKRRSHTHPAPQPVLAHPEHTDVVTTTRPKDDEMLRIEFQTADPNIRIIWFAPKQDASSTHQTEY